MTIYSATCIECGKAVIMAKVQGTGLAVAMEEAPVDFPYWTLNEWGQVRKGGALIEHTCHPDVVSQYMSTWLGNVNLHYELTAKAMARQCPKCGALPGTACMNLMERHRKGKEVPTKAPHPERYVEETQ